MGRCKTRLILGLLLLIMVTGASAALAADAKKQGTLTKVVLAEATRSEGWLPVYLAKELGYFKEEGLDPELVTYKDGPLALMGLLNGDAQFCIIGFEPVLMAFEKGQSSKVILTTLNSQPYMFVGRPGIKSISEMKGKAVFGGMPGSAPYFFIKTAVRNAGLNPDKDVTFASMEYGAEIVAMTRGDIDGAYVRATRYAQILEAGGNILVDATDPAQHKKIYGSERYEAMNVQVTDKYVKEHPEIIQAFSNAVYKAMLWQSRHSDEEVALAVSPSFPGRSIDAALIKVLRKCLSPDGLFTEEGYRSIVDFCLANGVIKKDVPMAHAIDQSFMKKAKASIQ
jgi:NitT/TauT family transport system substrate-binding protein